MSLARAVTGLTACHLCIPALYFGKLSMRSMRKRFELIFVAIFAGIAADVIGGDVGCWFGLARLNVRLTGFGSTAGAYPHKGRSQQDANEQRLDDSVWTQNLGLQCSAADGRA